MTLSKKYASLLFAIILLSLIYTLSGMYSGNYYTKHQSDDANDLNFMLYWSQEYSQTESYNYWITWGSLGVMILLQPFVELLGSHDYTIIVFGMIMWFIFRDYFRMYSIELKSFHWMLYLIILTGSLTYIAIPGKGSLSFITFYLALKYLRNGRFLLLLCSLVLAGLNRPVEILVVLAAVFYTRQSLKRRVFLSGLIVLALVIAPVVGEVLANNLGLDVFNRSKVQANFGSYAFLNSSNAVLNFLLTPLRMIAVSVSVVTSSLYSWSESLRIIDEPVYFMWRIFPVMLRLFSGLFLSAMTFFIFLRLRFFLFSQRLPVGIVLAVLYFLFYSYLITINGVEEKSRYFLLFPIILMPVTCYVTKRT